MGCTIHEVDSVSEYTIWKNRLVPILAMVDLPHEEDPPINGKEQVLATRYYLRVYPPQRGQVGTILPMRFDIPMAGITAGVARVLLLPSVGYGVNASYRVEYVAWRPVLHRLMVGNKPRIRVPERVVKEEYWKVPHHSGNVMEITIPHLMDRDPIPPGIMNPISVRAIDGRSLHWDIMELPMEGAYDKSLREISMGVELPIGSEYVIEYMAPLTLRDVVLYPDNRTYTEDKPSCHASSQCCPPLTAPWGRLHGTQVTSTPWFS